MRQAKGVLQARLLDLRALTTLTGALSLVSFLSAAPAVATTALEPSVTFNGPVYALAQSGDTLYVGGNFSSVNGQTRSNIAAVDEQDGSLLPTAPATNGTVYALAVARSHLYAGGHFTTADGEPASNLAAFGLESGGFDASFKAEPNETVYALLPMDESLYVGGEFSSIGGQSDSHLAVVQDTTGTAPEVNLNPGDTVYALASSGTTLYVGGGVATYSGENYAKVTAYETVSNTAVTDFSTRVEGPVRALAVSGSELYLGGEFNEVDGQQRANIAAVNREDGALESAFDIDVQSDFGGTAGPPGPFALAALGRTLFIGGDFDTVGELSAYYLAAVDSTSGEPLAIFQPNPSSQVDALLLGSDGSTLWAGGAFTSIEGQPQSSLARLNLEVLQGGTLASGASGGSETTEGFAGPSLPGPLQTGTTPAAIEARLPSIIATASPMIVTRDHELLVKTGDSASCPLEANSCTASTSARPEQLAPSASNATSYGHASVKLAPGHDEAIIFPLSAGAAKLLRSKSSLFIDVSISVASPGLQLVSATRTLELTLAKHHGQGKRARHLKSYTRHNKSGKTHRKDRGGRSSK